MAEASRSLNRRLHRSCEEASICQRKGFQRVCTGKEMWGRQGMTREGGAGEAQTGGRRREVARRPGVQEAAAQRKGGVHREQ